MKFKWSFNIKTDAGRSVVRVKNIENLTEAQQLFLQVARVDLTKNPS